MKHTYRISRKLLDAFSSQPGTSPFGESEVVSELKRSVDNLITQTPSINNQCLGADVESIKFKIRFTLRPDGLSYNTKLFLFDESTEMENAETY